MWKRNEPLWGTSFDIRHGSGWSQPREEGRGWGGDMGLDSPGDLRRWGPQDPGRKRFSRSPPQHLVPSRRPRPHFPAGSHLLHSCLTGPEANGSSALLLKTGNAGECSGILELLSPAGLACSCHHVSTLRWSMGVEIVGARDPPITCPPSRI